MKAVPRSIMHHLNRIAKGDAGQLKKFVDHYERTQPVSPAEEPEAAGIDALMSILADVDVFLSPDFIVDELEEAGFQIVPINGPGEQP